MTAAQITLGLVGLLALAALAGCETTAEKSARLEAQARTRTTNETVVRVTKQNPDVRVLGAQTITDANGTAVVATLRATARAPLADLPVAVDVRDAAGAPVFRNDAPGTEPGLVSATLLLPGRDLVWVHDQVQATGGTPAKVTVLVGAARGRAPARVPRLTLSRLRLTTDPSSGTEGLGRVTNRSAIEQRRLTIYAIARRGTKVVAAGRAVVNRLRAQRSASFAVYFIGDPRGARITLAAPATVLR